MKIMPIMSTITSISRPQNSNNYNRQQSPTFNGRIIYDEDDFKKNLAPNRLSANKEVDQEDCDGMVWIARELKKDLAKIGSKYLIFEITNTKSLHPERYISGNIYDYDEKRIVIKHHFEESEESAAYLAKTYYDDEFTQHIYKELTNPTKATFAKLGKVESTENDYEKEGRRVLFGPNPQYTYENLYNKIKSKYIGKNPEDLEEAFIELRFPSTFPVR